MHICNIKPITLMHRLTLFILFVFCINFNFLFAQDLQSAQELAASGKYAEAEAQYLSLLKQDPKNVEAIIGAAFNNSWHGDYKRAARLFEAALAIEPTNEKALLGQAYNLAWSGRLTAAFAIFQQLKRKDPYSVEARKGMGYVYLWQGNGHMAQKYFSDLSTEYPEQTEYLVALTQAHLQQNQLKKARKVLTKGLAFDGQSQILNDLKRNSRNITAPLEIDLTGGYSVVNQSPAYGLRTIMINGKIAHNTRFFTRFDNALSLDLASLVRTRQDARQISAGMSTVWKKHWATRAEIGMRTFPGKIVQNTFNGEQVYLFEGGKSVKAGGFYGWGRNQKSEWMAYIGGRLPISQFYAIEPYCFQSKIEDALQPERRLMLNNQFRFKGGLEINLAGYYGQTSIAPENGTRDIRGGIVNAFVPISRMFMLLGGVRYETTPFDQLLSANLGLRIRIDY